MKDIAVTKINPCFSTMLKFEQYTRLLISSSFLIFITCASFVSAQEAKEDLFALSLEELFSTKVTSASGVEESLRDAAASMIVITEQDIHDRAYTDLSQILTDLPGFDNIKSYGHDRVISYQRGYRTPTTQRTLFMINGVINNQLWSQAFPQNRQLPLTNIERIEVLYGPAGAIYGPNAFSGIVNIITRDARELDIGESYFKYNIQAGSFSTTAVDMAAGGKMDQLSYSISAKFIESDGPNLQDFPTWGYLRSEFLNDPAIWGSVLQREHLNTPYGNYTSMDKEQGIIGELNFGKLTFGINYWHTQNGYGLKFALDKGQPNAIWAKKISQWYVKYHKQLTPKLLSKTFIRQRDDRRYGNWAEATADWNTNMEGFSYVSISDWNVLSNSWKLRQDWDYQASDNLSILAGLKYENKELTKAFDVCGYWSSAFCSSSNAHNLGPEGLGEGVYHSTSTEPQPIIPGTLSEMPADNLIRTNDKGGYLQVTWDIEEWRYSAAIRWDKNSEYGSFTKPRLSAIYHFSNKNTIKLIYSTAFQEPGPSAVYGGWNGKRANPDLKPEEMENLELIWLYQANNWLHETSLYYANYKNVIKEEAENAGERDITGFEYRGQYKFNNFINGAPKIKTYLNYTFTEVKSNITYDHDIAAWIGSGMDNCTSGEFSDDDPKCRSVDEDLGDIAPHKINLGLNIPFNKMINLNFRGNYVSERKLYLRNPLRADGIKLDSYMVFNANIGIKFENIRLDLAVNNLFNTAYYHPGLVQANSGDVSLDEKGNLARYANGNLVRSGGFHNSVMPQVERNYSLIFSMSF
ncbi:TonB-dependent receptor plug domain-containing protein [Pseudoalteromonas denitrificans]|uniref:Iron complex outermembrane recepter protein n=1 Tax=Pseudoalteromonas denitrificans DSM 6059 TaxID=1123010 RepID=A0A1I1NUS0_9GAMM|nr:TonB-dependent receptor [Pseudoalteromonas denitrificans]SFC98483.1 iron complex outermembrane recepter protein [Pseudoalteromonas denitrificans DSM 6059]